MKVKIELEREDLDAMHDVILEAKGTKPNDEEIAAVWESLPEHIKGTAIQWGCNDTVFRDEMYRHLKEG